MLLLLPLACGETLAPPLLAVSTDFDFLTVPWLPAGLGAVARLSACPRFAGWIEDERLLWTLQPLADRILLAGARAAPLSL